MITWMEHPEHGRHPATGIEIEQLQQNGWVVCRRKHPEYYDEPAEEPAAKKRGRPPKNKEQGDGHVEIIKQGLQASFPSKA